MALWCNVHVAVLKTCKMALCNNGGLGVALSSTQVGVESNDYTILYAR